MALLRSGTRVYGTATIDTQLFVSGTNSATSTVTGALQVAGGVGIGGSLYVGGGAYLGGDLYVDGTQFIVNSVSISSGDKTLTLSTGASSAALALASGLQIGPLASPYITWLYDGSGNFVSSGGIKSNNTITIVSSVNATSTTTGALIVGGGAGFGGNVYAGGNMYAAGSQVLTSANLSSFGVSQITAGPYISVSPGAGTGNVTIGNLGVQSITTGSGLAVTTSTGTVNIASIDTLQLVTNRGFTTTNAINITNNVFSGNTNSNQALLVSGGVGALAVYATNLFDNGFRVVTAVQPNAGSGISVSGLSTSNATVSFTINNTGVLTLTGTPYLGVSASTGNITLTNNGVQTLTAGTDTAVSSNTGTITVWTTSTLQSVTNRGNTTSNAIYITNATASTSTTTGALTVAGGIGVFGDIYARNIYTNGNIVGGATSTSSNLAGGTAGAIVYQSSPGLTAFLTIGAPGQILTVNPGGTAPYWTGSGALLAGVAVTATNLSGGLAGFIPIQSANSQTSFITSGTNGQLLQMGVNTATWVNTSSLYVGNAQTAIVSANISGGSSGTLHYQSSPSVTAFVSQSTAGNVLVSGGNGAPLYQNTLTLTGGTPSTSPQSGALVVTGGAGFGGNVWIAGTLYATVQGSISTATNLYQGTAGAIPYQSAPGITNFIGIGGSGNLLQSNGSTATWVSTTTLVVGSAVSAAGSQNITGGATGSIPYQVSSGVTNFIAAGGVGSILQMGASTATFISTSSIYVGNSVYATTATNIANGATGGIPIQLASGITNFIGIGPAGTVLQSNGTTATWYSTGSTVVGTAININAGTAGQIPYQVAAGQTGFITPSVAGSLLQSNGTTATFISSSSITVGFATVAYTATYSRNLAGQVGANNGGNLHYQVSDNVSALLSTGTAGTVLVSQPGAPVFQNTLTLAGTTQATSTNSGAFQVVGGAGIGGNLYVGGVLYANVAGSINTSSNVNGGLAGDILYQSAPGVTTFLHGTVAGTIVQYNGSAPTYVSTTTLLVGSALTANAVNNLNGGALGSIPYQTAPGVTQFIGIGPAGYLFQSNGTTATWITTGSLIAGTALQSINIYGGAANQIPYQTAASATSFSSNLTFNGSALTVGGAISGAQFIPTNTSIPTSGMYGSGYVGFATGSANRLYIAATGNIGVGGNTTPGTALDVSGGVQVSGVLTVTNISSFPTNGNLNIAPSGTGGVYFGSNNIAYFQNTTNATSTQSGSVQLSGGLGVNADIWAKNIYSNSLDVVANAIMYSVAMG
jgi:hypothetical protein